MNLKIKKLHPNARMPEYATSGAACFDLFAASADGDADFSGYVACKFPIIFGTGLSFEIPEGWVMLIYSRSGHGFKHDTRLANCVGVIDSDYRGEVSVKLVCDHETDNVMLQVRPGDRIAQAMLVPVERVNFVEDGELSETQRGDGGFGSTGA